jgi:hypothetical protein
MASALKNPQSKLAAVNEQREKTYLLAVILFRIRLRLRSGEPTHDRLRTALAKFGEGRAEQNDIVRLRNEALAAAEAIIQEIWRQVQGGRVKGKGG